MAKVDWRGAIVLVALVAGACVAYYLGGAELALLLGGAAVGQQLPSVKR